MYLIDKYFKEVHDLLIHDDFLNLEKRMIDLVLDTENVNFYKKVNQFIDWVDSNSNHTEEIKIKAGDLLREIFEELKHQNIGERQRLIEITNLKVHYKKGQFTLGPISLDVVEGQVIGLVGENGNGKTTLLRTICGELKFTTGTIKYNLPYENQYDLRTQLIYIPQRTKDWLGSLLSNLRFTAASYGIKGDENYYLVELVIRRMGLKAYRNFEWKQLSSGYKMRFELARMLLRKPKLLLIDEPLANLDIVAQQMVLDDLKNIVKSPFRPLGVIFSSQQLYEVEKTSDYVIFLKNGIPTSTQTIEDNSSTIERDSLHLMIEMESGSTYDQLKSVFTPLGLKKLQYEGGSYILVFESTITQEQFLQTIVDNHIPITYLRDISNSSRRFFLS